MFYFLIAGYYCLSDSQSSDILHIDFQLDPANDTVNLVYAYESSNDTPLSGCHSEYDSTNKIHHLRITMNTTTQQQVSPSSSCGSSFVSLLHKHDIYSIRFHVTTNIKLCIAFTLLDQVQVIYNIFSTRFNLMTKLKLCKTITIPECINGKLKSNMRFKIPYFMWWQRSSYTWSLHYQPSSHDQV